MYTPTIGIEVHVELKTQRKVFSSSKNDYNALANTNVNEIDFGYPGVLPTVNSEVIEKSLLAYTALNFNITRCMHFDRKNYYYPDLPKGYQITQERTPIGRNGYIILNNGAKITIERMHIEEDTCKSIHEGSLTLLNYNRSGVPLIEIVSDPVIHSADDAMEYLKTLREILFYIGVSDCKIEEGSMRADVNVSLSKTSKLGTKVEIKNIGSIKDVGLAINYEIERQTKLLEKNQKIVEETRRFDSKTNTTILMRKKEVGNEYRYIPDPDIPFLYLSEEEITKAKESLPILPNELRNIYINHGISSLNADKIIGNKMLSSYLNQFFDTDLDFKIASNLLLGDILSYLNKTKKDINATKLSKEKFYKIVSALSSGKINNKHFKDNLLTIMESDDDILNSITTSALSNEKLKEILLEVLANNKESVTMYKNGKDNALKYLMGCAMKEIKGQANPKDVNNMLSDLLNKM